MMLDLFGAILNILLYVVGIPVIIAGGLGMIILPIMAMVMMWGVLVKLFKGGGK